MLHTLRAFYRQNATVIATSFFAFSLVTLGFVVDRFDVLPLQGQSTPVYSPLPSGRKVSIVRSSRSRSSRVPARLKNRSSAPAALHAGPDSASASSVSSSVSSWSGDECSGYGRPSDACAKKMLALTTGDYACLSDQNCWSYLRFSCTLSKSECAKLETVQWLLESFMPECFKRVSADCDSARAFFMSTAVPAVRTCLDSAVCRELLSTFRTGSMACRQYEPCLAALDATVEHPSCGQNDWCNRMSRIHSAITNGAAKCTSGYNNDCRKKLGLAAWTVSSRRESNCWEDVECMMQQNTIVNALIGMNPAQPIIPACFLWQECKQAFESRTSWACEVGMRAQQCKNGKAVYEFLTVTKPSCVTSGESEYCQQSIRNLTK